MAIITLSRKIASYGDEVARVLSEKLHCFFVDKNILTDDLKKKGLFDEQLKKYDERKPGFLASLSRERDKYFDFLSELIYEYAQQQNTVFIGRGASFLLKEIPCCYRVRLVASDEVRVQRIMKEFNWDERRAKQLIAESDANREGFHRCFFNTTGKNPTDYHLLINTDNITPENAAAIISVGIKESISDEDMQVSKKRLADALLVQKIINAIAFYAKLPIYFLDVEVTEKALVLHGVSDSVSCIKKATEVAKKIVTGKKVVSAISIAQDSCIYHHGNYYC